MRLSKDFVKGQKNTRNYSLDLIAHIGDMKWIAHRETIRILTCPFAWPKFRILVKAKVIVSFFIQRFKIYKRCFKKLKMDSDIKKNPFLRSMERFRCAMGSTSLNAGIFQSTMILLHALNAWSPSKNTESRMIDLFSTTEDGQNGNPIDFANDFIKLDSHLAFQAKFYLRIDFIFWSYHSCFYSCSQ